jgi:hypothetical protein
MMCTSLVHLVAALRRSSVVCRVIVRHRHHDRPRPLVFRARAVCSHRKIILLPKLSTQRAPRHRGAQRIGSRSLPGRASNLDDHQRRFCGTRDSRSLRARSRSRSRSDFALQVPLTTWTTHHDRPNGVRAEQSTCERSVCDGLGWPWFLRESRVPQSRRWRSSQSIARPGRDRDPILCAPLCLRDLCVKNLGRRMIFRCEQTAPARSRRSCSLRWVERPGRDRGARVNPSRRTSDCRGWRCERVSANCCRLLGRSPSATRESAASRRTLASAA